MKNLLTNKKGVTLLEGLIALLLLAVVSVGTFSVLLSVSRQPVQPDIQEEMLFAVERANNLLQIYTSHLGVTGTSDPSPSATTTIISNLKPYFGTEPLKTGDHDVRKLLPVMCDWDHTANSRSTFTYTVTQSTSENIDVTEAISGLTEDKYIAGGWELDNQLYVDNKIPITKIEFHITCNGYTL